MFFFVFFKTTLPLSMHLLDAWAWTGKSHILLLTPTMLLNRVKKRAISDLEFESKEELNFS